MLAVMKKSPGNAKMHAVFGAPPERSAVMPAKLSVTAVSLAPPSSGRYQASTTQPTSQRRQIRIRYAAAAVTAVIFACSVAGAAVAQQIPGFYSFGTWSTAALSVARSGLAATSLPNLGVAIFAGGWSTLFDWLMYVFPCEGGT